MSHVILFLDTVHPVVWEQLQAHGYRCLDYSKAPREDVISALSEAHGLIIRHRFLLDEPLLKHAPQLQWIGRSGVGLDAIDLDYCTARGITVLNAAGGNADAVGEYVIGTLLDRLRHLSRANAQVHQGQWSREANRGIELGSATMGIIGYGHTGRSVAKKLSGFGTRVLAYDKYRPVDGPYASPAELTEIQSECDIISFHVPSTGETHHYFDSDFLNEMSKPFYLVNASRGPVCDLAAVNQGLEEKSLLGACLDVLPNEPRDEGELDIMDPDLHSLLKDSRVTITPHIAGWTKESYDLLARTLVERIIALSS